MAFEMEKIAKVIGGDGNGFEIERIAAGIEDGGSGGGNVFLHIEESNGENYLLDSSGNNVTYAEINQWMQSNIIPVVIHETAINETDTYTIIYTLIAKLRSYIDQYEYYSTILTFSTPVFNQQKSEIEI